MSLPSTSEVTSEEQEQDQLEELVYELMGRSGLLSELKSRIAQFIQTNGRTKDNNYSVNFSRVNPNILSLIYEYLKWVGMKNTCALLLSESPVPISVPKSDETVTDRNSQSVPQLCTYLSGLLNQTDSQSSFILNETFTKGESNSIPLTSTPNNNSIINNTKTQRQEQQKSNGKESNNSLNGTSTTTNLNQTYVTKINSHQDSVHNTTTAINKPNNSNPSSSAEESNAKHGEEEDKSEGAGDSLSYNNSSSSKKQENNKESSGLKSSNSDQFMQQTFSNSKEMQNNGKGDDDVNKRNTQEEKKENTSSTPLFKSSNTIQKRETENLLDISNPLAHKSEMSEPDFDESISDLLDGKSEDETLDVSIDSDGKGMSSCEHVINLK